MAYSEEEEEEVEKREYTKELSEAESAAPSVHGAAEDGEGRGQDVEAPVEAPAGEQRVSVDAGGEEEEKGHGDASSTGGVGVAEIDSLEQSPAVDPRLRDKSFHQLRKDVVAETQGGDGGLALALLNRLEEVEKERLVLKKATQEKQHLFVEAQLENRCAALDAQLEAAQAELSFKEEEISQLSAQLHATSVASHSITSMDSSPYRDHFCQGSSFSWSPGDPPMEGLEDARGSQAEFSRPLRGSPSPPQQENLENPPSLQRLSLDEPVQTSSPSPTPSGPAPTPALSPDHPSTSGRHIPEELMSNVPPHSSDPSAIDQSLPLDLLALANEPLHAQAGEDLRVRLTPHQPGISALDDRRPLEALSQTTTTGGAPEVLTRPAVPASVETRIEASEKRCTKLQERNEELIKALEWQNQNLAELTTRVLVAEQGLAQVNSPPSRAVSPSQTNCPPAPDSPARREPSPGAARTPLSPQSDMLLLRAENSRLRRMLLLNGGTSPVQHHATRNTTETGAHHSQKGLEARVKAALNEAAERQSEVQQKNKPVGDDVVSLRRGLAAAERSLAERDMKYNDLCTDLKKMMNQQNETLEELGKLMKQLGLSRSRVKELEKLVKDTESAAEQREGELREREARRVEDLQRRLQKHTSESTDRMEHMRGHLRVVSEEDAKLRSECDELRSSLCEAEECVATKSKEIVDERAKRQALEIEIDRLQREVATLQEDIGRRDAAALIAARREDDARRLVASTKRRLQAEQEARSQVQIQCEEMLGLFEKQRNATETSRVKLSTLNKEVRRLAAIDSEWASRAREWEKERIDLLHQIQILHGARAIL